MTSLKLFFGFLMVALSLSSYAEDWITEEVLTQLTEIRKELSELREEVRTFKLAGEDKGSVESNTVALSTDREVPMLGNSDASVVVFEFSDYQCPYCRRHTQQTLPKIKENYIELGQVQYGIMDFPLGFHSLAKPAAIAARCAAKQSDDAYWAFHDEFFSNKSNALDAENINELAKAQKLNVKKFSSCLGDPKIAEKVDAEMAYGGSLGVSGTPAFFIGIKEGDELVDVQMLSGAQPYSVFSQVIERLLKRS